MEPNTELCTKCGKQKTGTKGATITQWISLCQCDALAFNNLPDSETKVETCQTCGKRVEEKRSGSLTQWIFKENSCRCALPQISMEPSKPPSAPQPVVLRRLEDGAGDDTNVRIELNPIIQPNYEPHDLNKGSSLLKAGGVAAVVLAIGLIAVLGYVVFNPAKTEFSSTEANAHYTPLEMEMKERPPADVVGSIGVKLDGDKIIEAQRFTPAAAAGLASGDRILAIDGEEVGGKSSKVVSEKLLGNCGTPVVLRVRKGDREINLTVVRTEDIYERLPENLTAKQYFKMGVEEKFSGKANRSRLLLTLAAERGDDRIKKQVAQELKTELPKNFVPFEAQKLNNESHNLLIAAAYKSLVVQAKECIAKYPTFEWPYMSLAYFYLLDEKADKAEELMQNLTAINPDFTDAWILRSIIKDKEGDNAEAKRLMSRAIELNPEARDKRRDIMDMLESFAQNFKDSSYVRFWKREAGPKPHRNKARQK
jgi:hypothetical protein